MTKIKKDYSITDITNLVKKYSNEKIDLITKSFNYVSKLINKDRLQDSLNVSYLLTTIQADSETISACILSYLFQDEVVKRSKIEKEFDFHIVKLASNVNKLKKISLSIHGMRII